MSEQLPGRLERASTIGQDVVKMLVREPVKEAVQEALLEEQIREQAYSEELSRTEDRQSDGGRTVPVKTLATIVGIAGIILFVQRRQSGRSNDQLSTHTGSGRGRMAGTDRSSTSPSEK